MTAQFIKLKMTLEESQRQDATVEGDGSSVLQKQ